MKALPEVRLEKPEDITAIHKINTAAFGRESEANLVDRLRGVASTLSFVAVESGHIVGHIFFSPVTIAEECPDHLLILGLAPVAVLPTYQRRGIGSLLIHYGLEACARSGCKAVVVLGSPAYYSRFGFTTARTKGLGCEYAVPDEAFMVLEVGSGTLNHCTVTVKYRPEFNELG